MFFPLGEKNSRSQLKIIFKFNCSVYCEIQTLLFEMMFNFDFKFVFLKYF